METTQHNSNKRERVKSIDHFIESGEHAPNVGIEAVLREVFPEQEEELASGLVAGSFFGWTWGDGTVVAQCFNPYVHARSWQQRCSPLRLAGSRAFGWISKLFPTSRLHFAEKYPV